MKRVSTACVLAFAALAWTATLSADVKTRDKGQVKFEGMLGRMVNMFGGTSYCDSSWFQITFWIEVAPRPPYSTGHVMQAQFESAFFACQACARFSRSDTVPPHDHDAPRAAV